MRVLMTGSTGFIGRSIVDNFKDDFELVCVHRRKHELDGVKNIVLDSWGSTELSSAVGAVDAVLHLAAAGISPDSRDVDSLVEGNVLLTARVVAAAAHLGAKRVVHAGSWSELPAIYGAQEDVEAEVSLYGAAKAASTQLAIALAQKSEIPILTLRLYNVYGPGESEHRLIPHIVGQHQQGKTPRMTSGTQERDFVFVDDVVHAFRRALVCDWPDQGSGSVEICTGVATSVRDVVAMAAEELDAPEILGGLGRIPGRPDEPGAIVGDPARADRILGWSASVDVQDGVARTIRALLRK